MVQPCADMKEQAAPMINPATGKPAVVEDLYPVFCKELAQQEMDNETRYFDIPEEFAISIRSIARHRFAELTIWKKPWTRQRRSTINSEGTTHPAATSSTPQ